MYFLSILGSVALTAAAYVPPQGHEKINNVETIRELNQEVSWEAGVNENFGDRTFEEVRKWTAGTQMGLNIEDFETLPQNYYDNLTATIPDTFDSRTAFSGMLHPIRNQEACGSCWAFSASEVLSDRFAIANKDKTSPVLSPEDLVSCDKGNNGCGGGMLPAVWSYLESTGIVTDTCFPYGAGQGNAPACVSKCEDGSAWKKYKASKVYAINGVENMQKEIMTNGPIQVAFMVYKSFMSYKSGVYTKHWYELIPEGGHAVKIIGWGTEDGTDYWLVANSWGTSWGEDGYFKIKRGVNECSIEKDGPPYAGLPAN